MARPAEHIEVTERDQRELRGRLRSTTLRKGAADRARVILLSARHLEVAEIARRVGLSTKSIYKWRTRYQALGLAGLVDRPRFKLHFTPTSASWLNAVEGWFGQLERRALYRSTFGSVQELRAEIKRYIESHNTHNAKPFRWTATAASIFKKVRHAKQALPALPN